AVYAIDIDESIDAPQRIDELVVSDGEPAEPRPLSTARVGGRRRRRESCRAHVRAVRIRGVVLDIRVGAVAHIDRSGRDSRRVARLPIIVEHDIDARLADSAAHRPPAGLGHGFPHVERCQYRVSAWEWAARDGSAGIDAVGEPFAAMSDAWIGIGIMTAVAFERLARHDL